MLDIMKKIEKLASQDKFEKIVTLIEEIPQNKQDWKMISHYVRALNNTGQFQRAVDVSMQYKEHGQSDALWHYRLGYAYVFLGRFAEAKEALTRAKELAGDEKDIIGFVNELWGAYISRYFDIDEDFATAHADNDIYSVIEPLWYGVNIYDDEVKYESDLTPFSLPQRYVFAIEWYRCEVFNGGHDQFYSNSTGIVWEDAMKGLDVIGAVQYAGIIKESAKRMGGKPSKNREERWKQMDSSNANFDDLDDLFYDNEAKLNELLGTYVQENAKDFVFSGEVAMHKDA